MHFILSHENFLRYFFLRLRQFLYSGRLIPRKTLLLRIILNIQIIIILLLYYFFLLFFPLLLLHQLHQSHILLQNLTLNFILNRLIQRRFRRIMHISCSSGPTPLIIIIILIIILICQHRLIQRRQNRIIIILKIILLLLSSLLSHIVSYISLLTLLTLRRWWKKLLHFLQRWWRLQSLNSIFFVRLDYLLYSRFIQIIFTLLLRIRRRTILLQNQFLLLLLINIIIILLHHLLLTIYMRTYLILEKTQQTNVLTTTHRLRLTSLHIPLPQFLLL